MDIIIHFFSCVIDLFKVGYLFFLDFFHGMQYVIQSMAVVVGDIPEWVHYFPVGVSVMMVAIVYTVVALRIIGRS